MPRRSKITSLPPEIKAELDRLLIARSFQGYDEIADWLNEKLAALDLEITFSRSGVHRYGQEFEAKCEAIKIATEQAKAIVTVVGDDEGALNESLIRMIQQLSFDILMKADDADIASLLPKLGIMVAKLSKASVDQKKYAAEARKKALEEAADSIEATAKQEGVSNETIQKIRRDVLMMAG